VRVSVVLLLFIYFVCVSLAASAATNSYSLVYMPAPAANPLKGFVPYAGAYTTFPYSTEWSYLPLRSLMSGPTNFDWSSLEALLTNDVERGHQTVFRVYLDYPTLPTGIPQYLLDSGLVTYSYNDYGNDGVSVSPDYENPLLDQALTNFIAALGARYDGDCRIGFVELGLLGYWGEWHTYPETNRFASVAVQNEVLAAYTNAFHKTKLLVRRPAGSLAPATLPIGYHDDSFAYDTVAPPDYNFLGLLAAAGETTKWLTQPVGGEVYPPVQSCLWDSTQSNCVPPGQEFTNCVLLTHASWMLNQAVFDPGFGGAQQNQALAGAHLLGYEFYVTNAILVDPGASGPLRVTVEIQNSGVAPFYYDWPMQLAVLNGSNALAQSWTTPWRLSSILPGASAALTCTQANPSLPAGQYKLLMAALNPMTNGVPIRFANRTQDADLTGWLTLGTFSVPPVQPSLTGSSVPSGFVLHVSGAPPGMWTVERTSDFLAWTPLLTTNTSTTDWTFTDALSSKARFYRVVNRP
jgi:hypothetical protein